MPHHQFVFGLLSSRCKGRARAVWNTLINEQGIDGFFDFYPTQNERELTLRFAEMFYLGRRAYLLSEPLQDLACSLLDRIDASVTSEKKIDTVINDNGVLIGFHRADFSKEEQLRLWIRNAS